MPLDARAGSRWDRRVPDYDAFGREVGEDTLSQWRQGSTALPPEPEPEQRRAPAQPSPAVVTAGDPLGTATVPPVPAARHAPPSVPGRPRRRRRRWTKLIVLLVVGWVTFNLIGNLVDEVEDAARTITIPNLSPPTPAEPPAGLEAGSLLRPAAFARALGDIRRRDIGRLQHLRVAPERIDATLHTPKSTLVNVQVSAADGFRRFSESSPGFPATGTIPYGRLDARAPQRLTRAAAERLGLPVTQVNYLVPSATDGKITWGAYFKNGAIFLADARGRITRRIN
jgi:hypothetical protein